MMLSRSSTTLSFSLQECLGLQPQMIHLKSLRVFRRKGKISWGSACDVTQSLAPLQLSWWITLLCGIILLLCRGEASQARHRGRLHWDDDGVKYVYNDVIHRNLQISCSFSYASVWASEIQRIGRQCYYLVLVKSSQSMNCTIYHFVVVSCTIKDLLWAANGMHFSITWPKQNGMLPLLAFSYLNISVGRYKCDFWT